MWKRLEPGTWGLEDGDYVGIVRNCAEWWIARVDHCSIIIDQTEVDGRRAAFSHVESTIKYAKWLREPNTHCPDCVEGDSE